VRIEFHVVCIVRLYSRGAPEEHHILPGAVTLRDGNINPSSLGSIFSDSILLPSGRQILKILVVRHDRTAHDADQSSKKICFAAKTSNPDRKNSPAGRTYVGTPQDRIEAGG
jgi:hypothetical protein